MAFAKSVEKVSSKGKGPFQNISKSSYCILDMDEVDYRIPFSGRRQRAGPPGQERGGQDERAAGSDR